MPRLKTTCTVPGCDRLIGNRKRETCNACDSSRHYWNRKSKGDKNARAKRIKRLQFFQNRMTWLFEKS